MTVELCKPGRGAVPVHLTNRASLAAHLARQPAEVARWISASGFSAAADSHVLVPGADGRLAAVWAGVAEPAHPFALSALPRALPEGRYRLGDAGLDAEPAAAAFSWELGSYVFDLYKPARRASAMLELEADAAVRKALLTAGSVAATRDLVNTPAEHLGPAELAEAVRLVARQHGARFKQTVGEKLLSAGFPAIHAVGRAATREPRLIELRWGKPGRPLLAIVGKGVCFDSGGLDIKSADGMRLMKKDMGGAANALGLAQLVMALELPVQLLLLIPAVENAVAGNAYRPGDVIKTRKGLHIEIGNTDAEGRVILCDALALAVEQQPALLIDMATLTGAARVALGPQLPALFTRNTGLARQLMDLGAALHDPVWHMPLWQPYRASIESEIADIVNTGKNAMAGAVTAALFLADFVPDTTEWLHLDLFAWNDTSRPGRPAGGEAQGLRTLLAHLEARFGAGRP